MRERLLCAKSSGRSSPGGAAGIASGHAPDGAPGEPGYDDAPGEPGTRLQVIMTALGSQRSWVLSQGRLEQQEYSFRYSSGKERPWLITPEGLNVSLGRDSLGTPHLHGTFTGPGVFVACQPEDSSSVTLLLDTGATTHVAAALWRTRLKILPSVGISTRADGGGVSASPGQGTPLIDFSEATGALPWISRFSAWEL